MMGGGAGHILDMIKRLQNNQALRKHRSLFKRKNEYIKVAKKKKIDLRHATKEEIVALRKRLLIERKKDNLKTIMIIIISLCITLGLVWAFVEYIPYFL